MALIDTSKIRAGTRVEIDGDPHVVTQYDHMKPGKGGAIVRLKLKSLTSGAVIDRTLKSGASLPRAEVSEARMQYLYTDGDRGVFMDQASYEQLEIGLAGIDGADLLSDGCEVEVLVHNGIPVSAQLPNFVELGVAETDPPERGGKLKLARLETGASLQVPSFVARGDRIRVDTRSRKYVERV